MTAYPPCTTCLVVVNGDAAFLMQADPACPLHGDASSQSVLREVAAELDVAAGYGYDAAHDRKHGLPHLLGLLEGRALTLASEDMDVPIARHMLIEVAALAVSTVKWLDGSS